MDTHGLTTFRDVGLLVFGCLFVFLSCFFFLNSSVYWVNSIVILFWLKYGRQDITVL